MFESANRLRSPRALMQSAKLIHVGEQEYLERELKSEARHEYVAGQVFAMVGASRAHNRIALNLSARLLAHLGGGPCAVFMSDVKLSVPAKSAYYYPDVVVTCDARDRAADQEGYVVAAPTLIVEVLSRSTEAIDRREKLLAYQTLDSLQEYALVGQAAQRVEIYRRAVGGWDVIAFAPGDVVRFASLDLALRFDEIYEGSDVPSAPA
jgi:Uma2 family endonuclease